MAVSHSKVDCVSKQVTYSQTKSHGISQMTWVNGSSVIRVFFSSIDVLHENATKAFKFLILQLVTVSRKVLDV